LDEGRIDIRPPTIVTSWPSGESQRPFLMGVGFGRSMIHGGGFR
jgi:hypothetical protein